MCVYYCVRNFTAHMVTIRISCVDFTSILNLCLGSLPTRNCNSAVMHSLLIKSDTNLLVIVAAWCKITRSGILFSKVKALLQRVHRGVPALFRKADINWSTRVDISICSLLSA